MGEGEAGWALASTLCGRPPQLHEGASSPPPTPPMGRARAEHAACARPFCASRARGSGGSAMPTWPSPVRRRRASEEEESVRLTTMQNADACRRHGRRSSPRLLPARAESKRTQPLGCRHTGTWKGGGALCRAVRGVGRVWGLLTSMMRLMRFSNLSLENQASMSRCSEGEELGSESIKSKSHRILSQAAGDKRGNGSVAPNEDPENSFLCP